MPRAWLEAELAGAADDPASRVAGAGAAVSVAGSALLARGREPSWVLRRARPEGGFACLELAPAWLAGAVAVVSEAGLAGAAVFPAGEEHGSPCQGRFAAPALLLVQDALHRVGSLAGVLEWCLRRPAGGRATLLFGDATGAVAGVRVDGDARRLLRPADGLLVAGGGREGELGKALGEADALGPAALARALGGPGAVLDPAVRRLGLCGAAGDLEWVALPA